MADKVDQRRQLAVNYDNGDLYERLLGVFPPQVAEEIAEIVEKQAE